MNKTCMISLSKALDYLRGHAHPLTDIETVPLMASMGRVLAADQVAQIDVPPADNSAMDGFAVRFDDLAPGTTLAVSQRIPAGHKSVPLATGTAARIFTGAEMPAGADTVVMQENCDYDGQKVMVNKLPTGGRGDNVRPRGQDISCGSLLLAAGTVLGARELGVLASIGIANVEVLRRLKVAIVSTGDELVEPGQGLEKGQIYNSNRYLLTGLLQSMGAEVTDAGCAGDKPAAIEALLRKAAESADCVISTGGVSVGDEDHVKAVLQSLGQLDFWKIAIKPGKPLAFGMLCGKPFFGLPGNPVSAFVTFTVLVNPFLGALQGRGFHETRQRRMTAGFSTSRPASRQAYLRAVVEQRDGLDTAVLLPNQSSGALTSARSADVLAIVPAGQVVVKGEVIHVIEPGR